MILLVFSFMSFRNIFILSAITISCYGQDLQERNVGGRCEGCEALLEYGDTQLNSVDTIQGFVSSENQLYVSGIVYQSDGKTPAKDVIIYAYHTDKEGIYRKLGNESGWGKRHGIHRGWVKTNKNGRYEFYTFRPASYPNTTIAQHIHLTVKELDTNPYYIDDIQFTDDPLLTKSEINRRPNRGGSGIVTPAKNSNNMLEVKRDIILGMNIPDY